MPTSVSGQDPTVQPTRACTKCGGSGPFGRDKKARDGFSSRCKKCAAENTRRWYALNTKCPRASIVKVCSGCGGVGPFYKQRGTKDGLMTVCVLCCKAQPGRQVTHIRQLAVQRRKANPEKARAKDAREREKYSARIKNNWLSWKYGLKPGDKERMIEAQEGKCTICQDPLKPRFTDVDHDHATLKIRGVLCRRCNSMLGLFKDGPALLECACAYLQGFKVVHTEQPLLSLDWASPVHANYIRKWRLQHLYGLSADDFFRLVSEQGGRCVLCSSTLGPGRETHIDHDHSTGKVRGLLCKHCNVALGQARESITILQAALSYLRAYREKACSQQS